MKKALSILTLLLAVILSSCGGAKLATANEQMERGEYFDASKTYRKVYNKLTKREDRPLRGEIAFKMGECYSRLNMNARASAAYQNAIRYAYPDSTTLLRLACSQQAEGKYPAALKSFEDYLNVDPDNKIALNGAAGCRMAIAAKGSPTRYVVKTNKVFNSRRADFSPMYFDASRDQLYFP
ncbi:MAG: tetratricopeptide repeat protein, partial [Muribaculaceae bacterium]|nr:tetratricopeptide repeat protein [Muribaculaceae bacterium]